MATTVTELTNDSTGRWLVTTGHGTTHVFDMDARTYERRPAPGRNSMIFDFVPIPLVSASIWPTVGSSFLIWCDDPEDSLIEHWRASTEVSKIEKLITE